MPYAIQSHLSVSFDGYIVTGPIHERLSVVFHDYRMTDTVHLPLSGFDCDVFSHAVDIRSPIAVVERVGLA